MGLFDFLKGLVWDSSDNSGRPNIWTKCPKCGTRLNLNMERCPGCGTHVDLLFRLKCPECGAVNDLKNKYCKKCGHEMFHEQQKEIRRPKYICPVCGYKANFYMLKCPSCGTRFG